MRCLSVPKTNLIFYSDSKHEVLCQFFFHPDLIYMYQKGEKKYIWKEEGKKDPEKWNCYSVIVNKTLNVKHALVIVCESVGGEEKRRNGFQNLQRWKAMHDYQVGEIENCYQCQTELFSLLYLLSWCLLKNGQAKE